MANEVVKKQLTDDLVTYSINYTAGEDCKGIAGMKLTGGKPVKISGTDVVRFTQTQKGQAIALKYSSRPDLAALVAEYNSLEAAKQAAREEIWAKEKAAREALDQPLLDAMHVEANRLRATIPADHLEVKIVQTGSADGDPILEYSVDGVKLNWSDVTIIGVASAIRPGALGAFATVYVASIRREQLEQIKATQNKITVKKAETQAARQKELTETVIPQDALDAYEEYKGDAEVAWEAEDETAWALINKWTPYIETQKGVHKTKLAKLISNSQSDYSNND